MTNRLIIHLPESCITVESDNVNNIALASSFCKESLDAYHSVEEHSELTIDDISQEGINYLHSVLFELGLL